MPVGSFSASEITALRGAGFLVSSGISRKSETLVKMSERRLAPAMISRQASGTVAAAGGEAAFDCLGGIGSARMAASDSVEAAKNAESTVSVPNIGAYLRLVSSARTHLVGLLEKFHHHEGPLYLLRERWDGAIESDNRISSAKRARGEFAGILPGKTRKWRRFHGLEFDWVLRECLGAGLVELFDTGCVGHGVRIV